MKKWIIAIAAVLAIAGTATAACYTHTIFKDGRYMVCTTCCYGGNCNTNCY